MGSFDQQLRLFGRLPGDLLHDRHEPIQRFFALGLGGLDHQGLGHHQWEVDRRGVKSEIEEPFGDIESTYAILLERIPGSHEFMHAPAAEGNWKRIDQRLGQIVGVQVGDSADPPQALGAQPFDIHQGAKIDGKIAVERMNCADGVRVVVAQAQNSVLLLHSGVGQVAGQSSGHSDRTGTGAAPTVGGGKCFMKVQMQDVESQIPRTGPAQDGVHVGPVQVAQGAVFMDQIDDVLDTALKDAQGVRDGQHQHGRLAVQGLLQGIEIDLAVVGRGDGPGFQSGSVDTGRIGAVGSVGNQDNRAVLLAFGEVLPGDHHAQQLAVGAGGALERHRRHAGDNGQLGLHRPDHLERPLDILHRLLGVEAGEPLQPGHVIIDLRIVFHRAAAQRVQILVNMVIQNGQPGVMPDHLRFADLGQADIAFAAQLIGNIGR